MVTKIGHGRKRIPVLYIEAWMEKLDVSYEELGGRLDPPKSRTTVWRWVHEPWRLDPQKMAELAAALGLNGPQDFWQPPNRRSLDAVAASASDDDYAKALDIVERLVRRVS